MSYCLFLLSYRALELIVIIIWILIIISVGFRCSGFLPEADMVSLFKFFLEEMVGSSGIDEVFGKFQILLISREIIKFDQCDLNLLVSRITVKFPSSGPKTVSK